MSSRTNVLVAWTAWAGSVALFALAFVLALANAPDAILGVALFEIGFMAFPTVGGLIASRRPDNPIGWIMCAVGVLIGYWFFAGQYAVYSLVTNPGALPGGVAAAWLGSVAGEPGWGLITTFLPLLFPTGILPSPRWRPVAWCSAIVIALQVVSDLTTPGPFHLQSFGDIVPPQSNPTGIAALSGSAEVITNTLSVLFVILGITCLSSVVVRYRRARGEERAQIRWFAYAAFLVPVVFFALQPFGPLQTIASSIVFAFAIAAFPIAIGIAVLRYRLWDIDNLINLTLVYGILTAVLVAIYLGSVLLLETLLRPLTGERNEPAIVISTLIIAALFNRLRVLIQTTIDARFYRRKYDAARTLARFGDTVRHEVDLASLSGGLIEVVAETMQPAQISLWLAQPTTKAGITKVTKGG